MMIVAHFSLKNDVVQTKSHSEFSGSIDAVSNNILKKSLKWSVDNEYIKI